MEGLLNSAADIISSADMMILAITGALIALMPIIKWTKNKTDDKYAEKALSYLKKATGFLSSFKKTKTK